MPVIVESGDGIFIPPGEEHKHMLRVLSDRIRLVLVEELLKRENYCNSASPV
jgi:quercetin dioxygenase-like cupin family protein